MFFYANIPVFNACYFYTRNLHAYFYFIYNSQLMFSTILTRMILARYRLLVVYVHSCVYPTYNQKLVGVREYIRK